MSYELSTERGFLNHVMAPGMDILLWLLGDTKVFAFTFAEDIAAVIAGKFADKDRPLK